jgi:hypothetical protein
MAGLLLVSNGRRDRGADQDGDQQGEGAHGDLDLWWNRTRLPELDVLEHEHHHDADDEAEAKATDEVADQQAHRLGASQHERDGTDPHRVDSRDEGHQEHGSPHGASMEMIAGNRMRQASPS